MNTNEADAWLSGGLSGQNQILDAFIARGDMEPDGGTVPPEALVLIAQFDAANTARAALVLAWAESRRAIIHGTSTMPPAGTQSWMESAVLAEARASALAEELAQVQRFREEGERQYQAAIADNAVLMDRANDATTRNAQLGGELADAQEELAAIRTLQVRTTLERDGLQARLDDPPVVQLKDALRIVVGETQDGRVEPGDMAYVDTLVVVKGFEQNIEAGWMRINVEPAMQRRGLL